MTVGELDELLKVREEMILKKVKRVSKRSWKKSSKKEAGKEATKKIPSGKVYRRIESNLQKTLAIVKKHAQQGGAE